MVQEIVRAPLDVAPVEVPMDRYSRSHLSGPSVLRSLADNNALNRSTLADLLADLGEAEERKLYADAAYHSLHAYCVGELNWSEQTAYKRTRAADVAREFPAIFHAVADGRLNLSGVILLKPHLAAKNVDELIAAAARKTRSQIEQLLVERAPKPDVPTRLEPVVDLSPGTDGDSPNLSPGTKCLPPAPRPKLEPLGARRFELQVMLEQETSDLLHRAQELLSHQQCSKDIGAVLHRALEVLVAKLEKRKYASTERPRGVRRASENPRTIPADVRRAVRERDGDQCTYVCPDTGRRCDARDRLEFDHRIPVARGGESSVSNVRQLCRTHNQHAADRAFGLQFMEGKRQRSRRDSVNDPDGIVFGLRRLGISAEEAREAAEYAASLQGASLEDRVKAALAWRGRGGRPIRIMEAPPTGAATASLPC